MVRKISHTVTIPLKEQREAKNVNTLHKVYLSKGYDFIIKVVAEMNGESPDSLARKQVKLPGGTPAVLVFRKEDKTEVGHIVYTGKPGSSTIAFSFRSSTDE